MPAAMGRAVCKMFLPMELSVKSFIISCLARHCAIGACKCYDAPMTVAAHSDPPASKFADSDLLSRTLSGLLAASLEAAIAARGLDRLVDSGAKYTFKLCLSFSGDYLNLS